MRSQASEWQKTLELLCASKDTKVAPDLMVFFFLKITHDSKDVQSWGRGMMVCVLKYPGRTMQQFFYSFKGKNTFVFLDVWCNSFGCFMFVFLHQCFCSWLTGPSRSIIYVYIVCRSLIVTSLFWRRSRSKRCIMSFIMLDWIQSVQSNCRGVLLVCVCVSNYTWTHWIFGVKFPSNTTLHIYIYINIYSIWIILLYIPICSLCLYELFSEVDERFSEILPWWMHHGKHWAWRPRHGPWHLTCA